MTPSPPRRRERAKPKTSRLAVAAQVAVAVAIMGLGLWAFQRGGYLRPVFLVAPEQAAERLPTAQPERLRGLIRVPGVEPGHPYRDQDFGIAIDRAGHPDMVKFLPAKDPQSVPPAAATESAVAQLRAWNFVPFQGKNGPAYARFVAAFTLVPDQDRPSAHTPFPQVADMSKIEITYDERGPKRLPRTVTIHGDGQVEIAIASVRSTQRFPETIPQETVRGLIEAFRRADFFSLKPDYGDGPADGTIRTVSIAIDGQAKTVGDHEGQYGGLPDAVMDIEESIQRAGGLEP